MNLSNRVVVATMFAAALAVVSGCVGKQAGSGDVAIEGGKQAAPAEVAIEVTEAGFVPEVVSVPKGRPATLVVTRKTDQTCARELVFEKTREKHDLPLNQAVRIELAADHADTLNYFCGMEMYKGRVVAR